ncbi:amidohydrolase family protein [Xanthovirga aplysinae]|uniref:amidohydrolase family protein n=1 Tax=Xanthovirga aplysinae TaxID=2529853 RepID=UPI0012BBFB7F|nr:amidohydrolase family protein [Xanthovirga aplysinae]MTI30598.1 amidohydrolase [Xanthovirga aplysinae]
MKILKYIFILILLCSFAGASWAQAPTPAAPQAKSIALVNGTAHLGNGEVIERALLTFSNGKIESVAANSSDVNLDGYEVINIEGKHIYPGLILPATELGLVEVEAVRATRDFRETGSLNPNVRALIAYNTDSELIPTLRFNGILLAQVTPQGGLVSGMSSLVQLDAWDWEGAAYKKDDGIHVNWPNRFNRTGWWAEPGGWKENKNYDKHVSSLESLFSDAVSYAKAEQKVKNAKLEALEGLFEGSRTLYIHVGRSKEIISSVNFAKKLGVKKVVLVGAEDAWLVKDFIKENNIPVILSNLHRLPSRPEEDVDLPFKLPYLLHQEGILVGLGYQGVMSSRNLPFFAGTAAAYGLNKEEALQMVTSNTAQILGIADKTGTLETGKDANLVISEGDLLDMRTNNLERAYIQGRQIQLDAKQQKLFEKYKDKYQKENVSRL